LYPSIISDEEDDEVDQSGSDAYLREVCDIKWSVGLDENGSISMNRNNTSELRPSHARPVASTINTLLRVTEEDKEEFRFYHPTTVSRRVDVSFLSSALQQRPNQREDNLSYLKAMEFSNCMEDDLQNDFLDSPDVNSNLATSSKGSYSPVTTLQRSRSERLGEIRKKINVVLSPLLKVDSNPLKGNVVVVGGTVSLGESNEAGQSGEKSTVRGKDFHSKVSYLRDLVDSCESSGQVAITPASTLNELEDLVCVSNDMPSTTLSTASLSSWVQPLLSRTRDDDLVDF